MKQVTSCKQAHQAEQLTTKRMLSAFGLNYDVSDEVCFETASVPQHALIKHCSPPFQVLQKYI